MTASLMARFCSDSAMRVVTKPFPHASIPLIPTKGVLRRERFSLLDDRRNHTTIFEHELQLRSVITAGSDLRAAKPLPNRTMLRGISTRRRSYSTAIQLAAVRH